MNKIITVIIRLFIASCRRLMDKLQSNGRKTVVHSDSSYDLSAQNANRYIADLIEKNTPLLVAKMGTVELKSIINLDMLEEDHRLSGKNIVDYITRKRPYLIWNETIDMLCNNAGFFPVDTTLQSRFRDVYYDAIRAIDVLGTYSAQEKYLKQELSHTKKIPLEGYYSPFLLQDPWTSKLKGKRVLVIHPFEKSIQAQYKKRTLLFQNQEVLPEFELLTIKAVQTIANEPSEFDTWFDALDFMKTQIDALDFDIALIGCGAYGLPLGAHVKKKGKQAIHLAGWTQMLFGIYGDRWLIDQPQYKFLINEHWTKPLPEEVPSNFKNVENGCYW